MASDPQRCLDAWHNSTTPPRDDLRDAVAELCGVLDFAMKSGEPRLAFHNETRLAFRAIATRLRGTIDREAK